MTIRPLVTAPPDTPAPSSNQGQLANLISDTGPRPGTGVGSQPKKKYHRRGKERRFGRGFRLIRNRHPFADDLKDVSSSSSSVDVLPPAPTTAPLQISASPAPQFANQVLSQDNNGVLGQQLLITNTTSSPTTSNPAVSTFDNQTH